MTTVIENPAKEELEGFGKRLGELGWTKEAESDVHIAYSIKVSPISNPGNARNTDKASSKQLVGKS